MINAGVRIKRPGNFKTKTQNSKWSHINKWSHYSDRLQPDTSHRSRPLRSFHNLKLKKMVVLTDSQLFDALYAVEMALLNPHLGPKSRAILTKSQIEFNEKRHIYIQSDIDIAWNQCNQSIEDSEDTAGSLCENGQPRQPQGSGAPGRAECDRVSEDSAGQVFITAKV
jgi:hypothetical protein